MKIKKTINILLLLFIMAFVTSCFDPCRQQSGVFKLPEGNYGGYIYACEREEYEFNGGRIGYTYQDRKYYYKDDDIAITIYYGFVIDELFNVLKDYNVEKFTYQISIYAYNERERLNILKLLKTEEIFVENDELLNKYECIKEVFEYQEPIGFYNGVIYKYSYTPHGMLEFKISTEEIMHLFELYRSIINSIDIEIVFDIIIDENIKFTICNNYIRFFEFENEISLKGCKHD